MDGLRLRQSRELPVSVLLSVRNRSRKDVKKVKEKDPVLPMLVILESSNGWLQSVLKGAP